LTDFSIPESLAPHTMQNRESPGFLEPHWGHLRGTPREVPHFLQNFDCFGFSNPQQIHFIRFSSRWSINEEIQIEINKSSTFPEESGNLNKRSRKRRR
jgi:hypothetical protein